MYKCALYNGDAQGMQGVAMTSHDSTPNVVSMPSAAAKETGLRREIPVDRMAPDPDQPRKAFDEETIKALASNIAAFGLINRITVRKADTTSPITGDIVPWRIVSGERRWRALRLLGRMTADVSVISANDRETAALALIENTCREDLNPIEKALGVRRLQNEFGYSQSEVAPMLQLGDRTRVSKLLSLLDLPIELHPLLADGSLSTKHGELLNRLPQPGTQTAIGLQAAHEGWSTRRLMQVVDQALHPKATPKKQAPDANVRRLQERLGEILGTTVTVRTAANGRRGDVVIKFQNLEVLSGILEKLGYAEDMP